MAVPASDLSPAEHAVQPLTVARVDLGAIRHNLGVIRARAPGAGVMGIVKADAYGHGALRVAQTLREEGVRQFAVATVAEGIELREAGFEDEILVFAAPLPHQLPAYAEHRLTVTVSSMDVAKAVAASGLTLRAQVKVDTGMHRIGVRVEKVGTAMEALRQARSVEVVGVWTHFATADSSADQKGKGAAFAREQMLRFRKAFAALEDAGLTDCPLHVANTGALYFVPDALRDHAYVRAGGALYGLLSSAALAEHAADLRPAMRLTTRVVHCQLVGRGETVSYDRTWKADRPTYIATLPVGYGDGLPRSLSNRGLVGIGGQLYPVAGRVCMDMTMLDLGAVGDAGGKVSVGDEAVIFGAGGPSAFEQANRADAMAYVMTTGLLPRVPRIYHEVPPAG